MTGISRTFARIATMLGIPALAYWIFGSPFSQLLGRFPFRGSDHPRVIALTFDDGPNEPYTSQIADFLHGEGIRATFFQVGVCVERFPAVSREMVRQGHVIGNHSTSHRILRCLTPAVQRTETEAAQRVIYAAIGREPALYRPPWLLRTPSLLRLLGDFGVQPVSGEFCHALEVFQPSPQRIARRALAKSRPGAILIFHDGFDGRGGDRSNTVESIKIVVDSLRRRGFRFVTVDELLDTAAYQEAGRPGTRSPERIGRPHPYPRVR